MNLSKLKLTLKSSSLILVLILIFAGGCSSNQVERANIEKQAKENNANLDNRLKTIRQRGKLICGINDQLLGFSYKEQNGEYYGISVDFCRALAVALFDNPTKVEFLHLKAQERFKAVSSGKVDILSRNTTWTLSRDTAEELEFSSTTFYDGQGILVSSASNIDTISDLNGKSICVGLNTTTEVNLAEEMRKRNLNYTPITFEDLNKMYDTYKAKKCDAATADRSELIARRTNFTKPDNHKLLPEVLSKEPLGSAIANGQPEWFDVVKWVTYAMIKGEELGINSQNVNSFRQSTNPKIRRFLGQEDNLGQQIGLSNDFAKRVIAKIGNYEEIYERNIGQPFNLERGRNALWKDGGLIYAPPFR